jgi:predicted transcriptional regulator
MHAVKVPQGEITLTPYQNHVYCALLSVEKPVSWRFVADKIHWHSASSIRTAVSQLHRFGLIVRVYNKGGEHRWLYSAVRG